MGLEKQEKENITTTKAVIPQHFSLLSFHKFILTQKK